MQGNKKQYIYPPKGGWKQNAYYIVDVAFSINNPIHRRIFYTGFLNDGQPAGYNHFDSDYEDGQLTISDATYVKARHLIATEKQMRDGEFRTPLMLIDGGILK